MPATPTPCPICGKPKDAKYRPFCSKRCADMDLHKWLSNRYAIPAEEVDDPDADDLQPQPEKPNA
jgi:endogenous inhibitor of DNA gyrase (YacG/DUF329 family)